MTVSGTATGMYWPSSLAAAGPTPGSLSTNLRMSGLLVQLATP